MRCYDWVFEYGMVEGAPRVEVFALSVLDIAMHFPSFAKDKQALALLAFTGEELLLGVNKGRLAYTNTRVADTQAKSESGIQYILRQRRS